MRIKRILYTLTFILFAGLTASVLAMAQPKPAASANLPNAATQIAESPDETAFKQMLVKNSPWQVTWETFNNSSGTHKLRFVPGKDGAMLIGEYFYSSSGTPPGLLENIVVKKNCVKFVTSIKGNTYDYCLTGDGTLKGTVEGFSSGVTAVAKPAAR